MKRLGICLLTAWLGVTTAPAQTEHHLAVLDEKLDKIRAEVEDLQFRSRKMQQQLDDLQAQINHLRKAGNEVDLTGLEARIKAVDAARERDKQIILDTLAKELATLTATRHGAPTPAGEHIVQKGETLSAIAAKYNTTADALVRANNLNNPHAIQVGQKLIIPK
jgi:LysM repeat protein